MSTYTQRAKIQPYTDDDDLSDIAEQAIEYAERCAVVLELDISDNQNAIWISWIKRENTNIGSGAKVIQHLQQLAEEAGIAVKGSIKPGKDNLLNFYLELGFEESRDGERIIVTYQ